MTLERLSPSLDTSLQQAYIYASDLPSSCRYSITAVTGILITSIQEQASHHSEVNNTED